MTKLTLHIHMPDWLKNNLWSIAIATITLVSMYTLYGVQIQDLQRRTQNNADAIKAVANVENQNLVTLEGIEKDIEYIKLELSQIETTQKAQ